MNAEATELAEVDDAQVVEIVYTNFRGETTERRIVPSDLWFGTTSWHPSPQWLLEALDVDKGVMRSFAVRDIASWRPAVSNVRD